MTGNVNLNFPALAAPFGHLGLGFLSYDSLDFDADPDPIRHAPIGGGTYFFPPLPPRNLPREGEIARGWSLDLYVRIQEDTLGNPTFRDGAGRFEQWSKQGASYVPLHEDNYIQATKTDGSYTLTFRDQTRMLFDTTGRITSQVDRNGNVMNYQYEQKTFTIFQGGVRFDYIQNVLTSVQDGKGRALYLTHNSDGLLVSIRDTRGTVSRETLLEYDSQRMLTALVDPVGNRTRFLYDLTGKLSGVSDPRFGTSSYTYYPSGWFKGRLQTETHRQQKITRSYDLALGRMTATVEDLSSPTAVPRTYVLTYNERYRVTKVEDPLGNVWVHEYKDPNNPYLRTRTIDPNLASTTYTYNAQSNLASITDTQGNNTELKYMEDLYAPGSRPLHANLVYEIRRPEVTVGGVRQKYPPIKLRYDGLGNLEEVIDPAGKTMKLERQADGQITAITDRLGNRTQLSYYPNGNLQSITTPGGADGGLARTTLFSHDPFDNPTSVTDPVGNVWRYQFDAGDRLLKATDARGQSVTLSYLEGLLQTVTAPANQGSGGNPRTTRYRYDSTGQLERILSEVAPGVEQMRARFDYTGFGELKRLIRLMNGAEKATSYSYDSLGRAVSSKDPLGRTSTVSHAPFCNSISETTARGVKRTYAFDTLCQLKEVEVSAGKTTYAYDELGRLVSVTQPGESGAVYGSARYGVDKYGAAGSASESRRFEWDSLDRLTRVIFPDGKTIQYGYDAEGQLTRLTDAFGKVTAYTYYADGRLKTVSVQRSAEADRVFSYRYDVAGRLSEIVYPASTGIVCRFQDAAGNPGWNANGQLTHLRYLKNGAHFHSFEYSYDASGNRTQLVDTPQNTANKLTWQYSYDWLNRLSEVKKGVGAATPATERVYVYDESDNRTYLDVHPSNMSHRYTYDVADQISKRQEGPLGSRTAGDYTDKETFTHNADGNMIARVLNPGGSEVTTTYTYNDFDSLVRWEQQPAGTSASHSYDAGRIRKSKIGTDGVNLEFKHSGLPVVSEKRDPSGTPTEWAFIIGDQVLGFQKGTDFFYFITDGLGSVRVLVEADGDEAAHYVNDEFGNRVEVSETSGASSQTFVGALGVRDEMPSSGLYLMGLRWMDPRLGRFLTQDPIGYLGGPNLYSYVAANPVNFVDPEGLETLVNPGIGKGIGELLLPVAEKVGEFVAGAGATSTAATSATGIGVIAVGGGAITAAWLGALQAQAEAARAEAWALETESRLAVKMAAIRRNPQGFGRLSAEDRSKIGRIGQCHSQYAKDLSFCGNLTAQSCQGKPKLEGVDVQASLASIKGVCRQVAMARFAACLARAHGGTRFQLPPRYPF
ncbi:MAG: RHS repeat protein [Deltaproteobacteria bacterium]|nr:RHS repeat protein [Deltaproteobacteria bacterium]